MNNKSLFSAKQAKILLLSIFLSTTPAYSQYQGGSPLPGSNAPSSPVPGNSIINDSAPLPGQFNTKIDDSALNSHKTRLGSPVENHALPENSLYSQLPINFEEAKAKIEELNNRLEISNSAQASQIKNHIYALSEWLQDVANAHWKMYKAFEKSPATKLKADSEKEIALGFSHLKNRAKLLKADLFIKQKRYPEALEPLVDIVVAEPRTDTGKQAYKRLVDMGFSKTSNSLEIAAKEAKAPESKDKK